MARIIIKNGAAQLAGLSTTPAAIFAHLKKIAPSIAFSVSHEEDPNYRWDGDGPDPAQEGYVAYDVNVIARAIVNGEDIEGRNSLGGTYDKPSEFDEDIGGYLPQMLEEAAGELLTQLRDVVGLEEPIDRQAMAAKSYLREVMKLRYDQQRRQAKR